MSSGRFVQYMPLVIDRLYNRGPRWMGPGCGASQPSCDMLIPMVDENLPMPTVCRVEAHDVMYCYSQALG